MNPPRAPKRAEDDTEPGTPTALALAEKDIDWLKEALARIEAKPHVCVQVEQIAALGTWRKLVGGIMAAVALTALGSVALTLGTCQSTGHAQGVIETRTDNHSARILGLEQSLREMDQARAADTSRILEAIRETHRHEE